MFLQIRLDPGDKDDRKSRIFRFNRVTFGLNCSPFLAMAVPHHQAIIMEAESAMAAENVRKNMHIDDIVLSCEEEAIRQVEKLRKLMESGNGLVEDHQQVKTLGMIWNCENDELSYNISPEKQR
ncbi:conserved hypothetical protein [Trichinella spiralis]|uniref:hypothetical protein n=1 Tax=Trichinella spiralis TaxID=6334 RepID=UPI0001EFC715|nr:conserved hypothetical protein [Trichinella spiralis]